MDHVLRYQDTPGVKMIVVLGEVSLFCFVKFFFSFSKKVFWFLRKSCILFMYKTESDRPWLAPVCPWWVEWIAGVNEPL